jgi:methionine-rich copper-binding protein CopC
MSISLRRLPVLVPAAVLVAIVLGAAAPLHMRLVKSFPEKDQVVTEGLEHIQLWFSQNPEVALTRVRLVSGDGVKTDLPKAAATEDPKSVTLAVPDSLPMGEYTVLWQTAAPDGHKVKGEFAFNYARQEGDSASSR